MEEWKTYNVLRQGARYIVRSRHPELTDEQVEKVLDKLFEICSRYKDSTELTGCIYANMRKAVKEVVGHG